MRTNKQICSEIADKLYGGNLFVFDTRGNAAEPSPWSDDNAAQFEKLWYWIPGLEDFDGHTQTRRQVSRAIQRIVDEDSFLPKWAWEDPLLRFCRVVGRRNAARITRIKIEGYLRVCERMDGDRRPAGLGRVMKIYTPVLKEVFIRLRSLTFHIGVDCQCINMTKDESWHVPGQVVADDDPRDDEGKSQEAKLDAIVGRTVRQLKGLKHLQLGDYKDAEVPSGDMEWDYVTRWMEIVKKRDAVNQGGVEEKREAREIAIRHHRAGHQDGSRGTSRGSGRGRGRGRGA